MTETSASPARPVSLFTIAFLLVLFAAFLLVVRYFYQPTTELPNAIAAENYPKDKDAAWRATSDSRRETLQELKTEQAKQLSSYRWVDQQAGKVQLSIERAMELTAQHYGARK